MSWNCESVIGAAVQSVQCNVHVDIVNYASLCKAKITRTAVLLEEVMASHKPE